ncbi:MAG: NAD(P)-dependent oxidoreductase [Actinomycetota bacterium]|nr:NAD(P)-dependent oxidoreductase [Actinomycetota bacterium]
MHIAVLGMGRMGRAMALRLINQGHEVTIWNRTPGRAGEVTAAGAREASSIAQAGSVAEVILISVADDRAVREVVLESSGLLAAGTTAVIVNASTVSSATTKEMLARVPPSQLVVSPVLGGPQAVASGTAVWLLGGERDVVEQLNSMWKALSSRWLYCGPDPNIVITLKLIHNYLLMAGIAVLAEGAALGQAAGMDANLLREFLLTIPLVAPGLHNRLDDVLTGDHRGWFTTRLGVKDLRLFEDGAATAGLHLPIADLVRARYEQAADTGWDAADLGAVVELLRTHPR